jgi:hypothetical protein
VMTQRRGRHGAEHLGQVDGRRQRLAAGQQDDGLQAGVLIELPAFSGPSSRFTVGLKIAFFGSCSGGRVIMSCWMRVWFQGYSGSAAPWVSTQSR